MASSNPPRPRLGRGLSALFSAGPSETPAEIDRDVPNTPADDVKPSIHETLQTLPVDLIDVNPHQPRRQFDETSLQELSDSLKMNGLIQPIVVTPVGQRFQLIAGERRLRAARLAKLSALPAVVRKADSPTQAQWALVENIQRENLNPIDRAAAYRDLLTQLGLTQAELAQRLGEQRSSVANYLRLLDLHPPVRDLVAGNALSLGHAKVLAGVSDEKRQIELAQRCVSQSLSVRQLEQLAANLQETTTPPSAKPAPPSAHLSDLERRLTQHVGLRVAIQKAAGKGKGKMVIHYSSLDQFDELLRKLGYENAE